MERRAHSLRRYTQCPKFFTLVAQLVACRVSYTAICLDSFTNKLLTMFPNLYKGMVASFS